MHIETTKPEVEELIKQCLQSGNFATPEEMIFKLFGRSTHSRRSAMQAQ